jgi:hypothetical protein
VANLLHLPDEPAGAEQIESGYLALRLCKGVLRLFNIGTSPLRMADLMAANHAKVAELGQSLSDVRLANPISFINQRSLARRPVADAGRGDRAF